jgi:glycyl-tRNA synthetase beta chain
MKTLLLEIQTEEIPAGYIEPALASLSSYLLKRLKDIRIGHGAIGVMGTPRRLAVSICEVAPRQRPLRAEIIGPPHRIGFDETGNPTVAARKFAEKIGIAVEKIGSKETPKGRYLCAEKIEKGLATKTLLKAILPDAILAVPFPKTMRWGTLQTAFARPIHAILALLGESVISFQIENIKSGRSTLGHRFTSTGKIKISHADQYTDALRAEGVLVDIIERKDRIRDAVTRSAQGLNGTVLKDDALLDIVKNLVEFPAVVAGGFDHKFLELPREVLITAMREHQKYFAVVDEKSDLMGHFIAVNNTPAKDMALVAKGHERVLRARLEDARFFYKTDLNTGLDSWATKLHGVLFQAKLGSMHEKVNRVENLTVYLADALSLDTLNKQHAVRASQLCKLDLVSQVVGEFPKLQGIMGGIYAAAAGEPETVATAVEEHYRPTHSGGVLPDTIVGALLSIADKMDSICGCFSIGLIPTGASDPYALRRQGIGMIQTVLDKNLTFSLHSLIHESLTHFNPATDQTKASNAEKVYVFLKNRMFQLLADEGYPKDLVAAVASVSADHVPNLWNRVRALSKLKSKPDFEPLAVAFKRVVNIIRQAEQKSQASLGDDVDERLFEKECEAALLSAYQTVYQKVTENLKTDNFDQALYDIASLRGRVDAFFDGVMVLTENNELRKNRLALLKRIAGLFETFADFSKIST